MKVNPAEHLLSRRRKMHFSLIENGITDRNTHHYMEARSFRRIAEQHGIQTVILANKQVQDDIRDELVQLN